MASRHRLLEAGRQWYSETPWGASGGPAGTGASGARKQRILM